MPNGALGEITMIAEHDGRDVALHRVAGGVIAAYSARCPEKRTPNEDAAVLVPCGRGRGVLAVADGVGGAPAGQDAALIALSELAAAVHAAVAAEDLLRTGIMNGIERASQAVADLGVGAAATLAVAEIDRGHVRPYHVGDCLLLVVGQRGRIKLETIAHSPVGYAVESGLLDHADALHHEDRHLISNAVGATDMRIEVGSMLKLSTFDTVLLASDGLSDNLHVDEIVDFIRKGRLARSLRAAVTEAARRMQNPAPGHPSKPDDLTCIAFRLGRHANNSAADPR